MTEALKMYPSGFLGSPSVQQTEPMDVVSLGKRLFNKGMNPKVNRYVANQEVVDLWETVHAGTADIHTFAFKERILRAALAAFGTERVVDWVGTQPESQYFSSYHRQWIDETLAFVFDGKRRELSENNWRVLLTTERGPFKGERFSRGARHYLLGDKMWSAASTQPNRDTIRWPELLAAWCARDKGIEDLMGQLNNLFGKR